MVLGFFLCALSIKGATLAKMDFTGGAMLDVLFKEWARNNAEQASELTNTVGIIVTTLTGVGEQLRPIIEAAEELRPVIEVFCPELAAARFKKRYEETGVAIQTDEAAQLALLLLALRIPYTGPEPRPDGIIVTIRDFEMLAYDALRNDSLSTLIEDSITNPVAYRAVQEVLRNRRAASEEIPGELQQWSYDVAVSARGLPKTRPGRNPFTNQVRDDAIIRTMETLISCGLKATRKRSLRPDFRCRRRVCCAKTAWGRVAN